MDHLFGYFTPSITSFPGPKVPGPKVVQVSVWGSTLLPFLETMCLRKRGGMGDQEKEKTLGWVRRLEQSVACVLYSSQVRLQCAWCPFLTVLW